MSKTRLIEAVKHLDLKETKEILEAKPELLKLWNDQGRNLLHLACGANCKKLERPEAAGVRKRGAQPTSLYAAGWWDDTHILKLLIEAGADIEVVVGVTPFLACWGWGRFASAKVLALKGANVNYQDKRGRTALHIGIEKEYDPALLKWLVQHGASPDIPDREGVTARLKASRKRKKKFLAALESA